MSAATIERDYAERIARLAGGAVPEDRPGAFIRAVEELLARLENELEYDCALETQHLDEEEHSRLVGGE